MYESGSTERPQKPPIEYPYLPEGCKIEYVDADNEYIKLAKAYAQRFSLDAAMPNTSVIVRNNEVVGIGANGSNYHEENGCERVRRGLPSGQGYELCDGCSPKNHGEQSAINDAHNTTQESLAGAEVYLWGHWWCCEPCWDAMQANGISTVYLLEGSEVLFNRDAPGNVIGRQFN